MRTTLVRSLTAVLLAVPVTIGVSWACAVYFCAACVLKDTRCVSTDTATWCVQAGRDFGIATAMSTVRADPEYVPCVATIGLGSPAELLPSWSGLAPPTADVDAIETATAFGLPWPCLHAQSAAGLDRRVPPRHSGSVALRVDGVEKHLPYRVAAVPFAGNVLVTATVLGLIGVVMRRARCLGLKLRARHRAARDRCPTCVYPLGPSGRCPECGDRAAALLDTAS